MPIPISLPAILLWVCAAVVLVALALLLVRQPQALSRAIGALLAAAGSISHALATLAARGRDACRAGLQTTLRWRFMRHPAPTATASSVQPPASPDGGELSPGTSSDLSTAAGVAISASLSFLAAALCVLLAEFQVGRLRSGSAQLGSTGTAPASAPAGGGLAAALPLDTLVSLQWLALATLWGAALLDGLGITPPSLQLLPFLGDRWRRPLAVYALVGFALTVIGEGLLFLDGQLIVDGVPWPGASEVISTVQGVAQILMTPLLLSALALGILALLSVACALLFVLCAVVEHLLVFATHVLLVVAQVQPYLVYVSAAAARGLYNGCASSPVGRRILLAPLPPLGPAPSHAYESLGGLQRHSGGLAIGAVLLPAGRPYRLVAPGVSPARPTLGAATTMSEDEEEEERMAALDVLSDVSLEGLGRRAKRPLKEFLARAESLKASRALLANGLCDVTRPREAPLQRTVVNGILPLSPTRGEIEEAIASCGDVTRAEHTLIAAMNSRLVAVNMRASLAHGLVMLYMEPADATDGVATQLVELKRLLPNHTLVVQVQIPTAEARDERFSAGLHRLVALRDEGVIVTSLAIDERSRVVTQLGEDVQDRLVAIATASLLRAVDDDRNPAAPEVFRRLGARSPLVGIAFEVAPLSTVRRLWWWEPGRRAVRGPIRGRGGLQELRNLTKILVRRVLQGDGAATVDAPIDATTPPIFVVVTLPLWADSPEFEEFASELRRWLANEFPAATLVLVQGNPAPDPLVADNYYCQVSCFFGVGPLSWMRPELAGQDASGPATARSGEGPQQHAPHPTEEQMTGEQTQVQGHDAGAQAAARPVDEGQTGAPRPRPGRRARSVGGANAEANRWV